VPELHPSPPPDDQRVAYLERSSLKVKDTASQALVAEWRVPFATQGGPAWSPTGKELCLGGRNSSDDWTGLWICGLDANEPARALDGQVTTGSWSPDGTKLAFCVGSPYSQIWVADVDPVFATVQTLGPVQTQE
jgi:Tol biopolymer transport system component